MFKSSISSLSLSLRYLTILSNDFPLGACSSDPLAKTMCGSLGDSFTYSTGKFLLVRFKTDISVTDRGFSISYVLLNSTSTGTILCNSSIILIPSRQYCISRPFCFKEVEENFSNRMLVKITIRRDYI